MARWNVGRGWACGSGGYWWMLVALLLGGITFYLACLFDSICVFIAVIISCLRMSSYTVILIHILFLQPCSVATKSNKGK